MIDPTQRELTEARINIARLQEQVAHLSEGMQDLQESNALLTATLDQMLLALSEARGGWRTLMAVGGFITWAIGHFSKGRAWNW